MLIKIPYSYTLLIFCHSFNYKTGPSSLFSLCGQFIEIIDKIFSFNPLCILVHLHYTSTFFHHQYDLSHMITFLIHLVHEPSFLVKKLGTFIFISYLLQSNYIYSSSNNSTTSISRSTNVLKEGSLIVSCLSFVSHSERFSRTPSFC